MELPVIWLPQQPRRDEYQHANDTFRELVRCWEAVGLCRVIVYEGQHVWWGSVGEVLLYDRPTLRQLINSLDTTNYRLALFGNPVPPPEVRDSSGQLRRHLSWCFWGRHPRLLNEFLWTHPPMMEYQERPISTIFLGKVENHVQAQWRCNEAWSAVIERFEMVVGESARYPYSGEEYLCLLAQARFGLTLRGFGPKCNREIELLALGTVLLVTPGVDTEHYAEPLIEGQHFLRVNTPQEVATVVASCSPAEWQAISLAGREWYERNCSIGGSFNLTKRLIDSC